MGGIGSGRKPKPAAIKLLEGNPGKRDIPDEIKPAGVAAMPERFNGNGEHAELCRHMWAQVVPELTRLGLATSLDQAALEQLCEWYATLRQAQLDLDYQLAGRAFDKWQGLASRFGFSPVDRAKLAGLGSKPQEISTTQRYLA